MAAGLALPDGLADAFLPAGFVAGCFAGLRATVALATEELLTVVACFDADFALAGAFGFSLAESGLVDPIFAAEVLFAGLSNFDAAIFALVTCASLVPLPILFMATRIFQSSAAYRSIEHGAEATLFMYLLSHRQTKQAVPQRQSICDFLARQSRNRRKSSPRTLHRFA